MEKFKNYQRPRRKYRFNIVGHKKALQIWRDSPFKTSKYWRGLPIIPPYSILFNSKTGSGCDGHDLSRLTDGCTIYCTHTAQ